MRPRSSDVKKTSPYQTVNTILLDYTFLSLVEEHLIQSPAPTAKNEQVLAVDQYELRSIDSVWNSSLYRLLPIDVWNTLRNKIISEGGRKCQICGEIDGVMNLHETWKYDDKKHVQKLVEFILLCKMCHHVKHIGLSGILADEGKLDYGKMIEHFCRVNNCSEKEFEKHVDKAFEISRKRSRHQWKQDFGNYEEFIKK